MKTVLKLFYIVIFTLSLITHALASDNISGLWEGTLNSNGSGANANYKDKIYLSIHQTTNNVAVIFLSAAETTQDLFSSTYLGTDLNKLDSYGVKAYFPNYNPIEQSLNYINTSASIRIEIPEGGQSGLVYILCDTCSVSTVIVIHKIL